ncbi:hypothetical protein K7A42_23925 [Agrobacterium sp. InxBP2]|uniref:hypothetical protein n=1 Tax=Agrobacterium sp. InxBP2 TaxID=2870329 RepID=UPI00249F23FA|nr:hypothetical protein [Agrobacterium sp. InxBP2]MCW8283957.1 hypothetical protein [Agrobacterium sp. InxBP2]
MTKEPASSLVLPTGSSVANLWEAATLNMLLSLRASGLFLRLAADVAHEAG